MNSQQVNQQNQFDSYRENFNNYPLNQNDQYSVQNNYQSSQQRNSLNATATNNHSQQNNVLQPNSSFINQSNTQPPRNQESASTKPSEVLSTENSESSLSQPVITVSSHQINNKQQKSQSQNKPRKIESQCNYIIDEINSMMSNSKPSTTKANQNPLNNNMIFNQTNNKTNELSLDHSQSCIQYNESISIPTSTKYNQEINQNFINSKISNQINNDKGMKNHNFSEIKNKISMFNLQQFQSPEIVTTMNKLQQSPDRDENHERCQVKGTNYQSSPDSLMEGVINTDSKFGQSQIQSNVKGQSKQMISICTQDYNITELQSPLQDIPVKSKVIQQQEKKKHSKSLNHGQPVVIPIKKQNHNETQGIQNISLSILMEEDSNSQQIIETKAKGAQSTTNLRDQRQTPLQTHNQNAQTHQLIKKPIFDKQRSTTSLSNKVTSTLSNQPQIHQQKSNSQNAKKGKLTPSNTAHCMIQKQKQSGNKTQQIYQSRVQGKIDIQKQLDHFQSQNNQNVSSIQDKNSRQLNMSGDSKENKAIKAHKKQIQSMAKKQVISRTLASMSGSQCQTAKPQENHNNSIAKILMPQFTNEKLLKIRTPLGQSRSKNSGYMSGIDGSKSISSDLQKSGNKEQQYKSEQSNLDKIEIELPIEHNNLNQSKTFDNVSFNVSAKEEPLTMRDLEMIEQNKNKQSEDNSELMLPKVETEIQTQDITMRDQKSEISINHSKKLSQNSMIATSSRVVNTECEQSIIHSGSMTTRDKPGPVQIGFLDKHTVLIKKRTPASRLHGTRAESRLSNLVQTIQKYKNEGGVNDQQPIRSLSREDSLINMQFDHKRDDEQLQLLDLKLQQLSLDSQQLRKSKVLRNENGSRTSSISSIHSTKDNERPKTIVENFNIDEQVNYTETINQLDNVELRNSVIKLSNDFTHSSQISQQQQLLQVQQRASEVRSSIQSVKVFQNDSIIQIQQYQSVQNHKRDSHSPNQKSRNTQNNQDYFSFSNVEKENFIKTTQEGRSSQNSVVSQKDSKNYESQEINRLERSDTMVKLTVHSDKQSQSIQSSHQNSVQEVIRINFRDLTGDVLDIISEFLPNHDQRIPPKFVLINSTVLYNYCTYKKENFSIQNEILVDQIAELKRELFDYFDQKLFKMSKGLSIIYFSNINSKEWVYLEEMCKDKVLNKDDLTLLRVYLLLLGIKPKQTNIELQDQIYKLIYEHKNRLNQIFNPELHFTFGPQILCQVGSLLQNFSLESYIINYQKNQQQQVRKIRTLQILAQIIYEALQFCKIVPNRIESDIRELERVIDQYTNQQDRLERMIMIKEKSQE